LKPQKKQDVTFLVAKDHTSMMRVTKFDLTKDPFAATMSKIDTAGRPTRGAKASKVVVVNFDDFECRIARACTRPYSRKSSRTMATG